MQTALWFILSKPLWSALVALKPNFKGNCKEIFLSLFILALLFFGLLYAVPFRTGSPLQSHIYKISILTLIAFCLIMALACVGI